MLYIITQYYTHNDTHILFKSTTRSALRNTIVTTFSCITTIFMYLCLSITTIQTGGKLSKALGNPFESIDYHDHLKNAIVTDSKTALITLNKARDSFYKNMHTKYQETQKTTKNGTNMATIMNSYASAQAKQLSVQFPAFMLDECTTYDASLCVFSRFANPHLRAAFETYTTQMIAKIVEKHKKPNTIFSYVGFGVGNAYQDFAVIIKALNANPTMSLNIHLIDGSNIVYTTPCDFLKRSHEIVPGAVFDWQGQLNAYIEHTKTLDDRITNDLTSKYDETVMTIMSNVHTEDLKWQQFIQTLRTMFPHATIRLFIHDLAENYTAYIHNNGLEQADLITATDIQDEMSLLRNSVKMLYNLTHQTAQKNPHIKTVWLSHWNNGIGIRTISAQKDIESHNKIEEIPIGHNGQILYEIKNSIKPTTEKKEVEDPYAILYP